MDAAATAGVEGCAMTQAVSPDRNPSVLRIQAVLVTIALVAGLSIATVHEFTRPLVQAQRGGLLGNAALEVLPGAASYRLYARGADGGLELLPGVDGAELFLGVNDRGEAVGVAIVASGMGYQDTIQLVYGLDPQQGRLLGMRVVASRETPGLGSLIVEDAGFVGGFSQVVLQVDTTGALEPLRIRDDPRYERGEIDAISGATVSVRAVAQIISRSLDEWLPVLRAHYDGLAGDARG
jgi:Na+-translocating ferredoxin:NAD+ oxidoreductase subunit G